MARGYRQAPGSSPEINEAQLPNLDNATLAAHGRSKNAVVRAIIAARTDCPFGLMVTLAHDPAVEVRTAVAGNSTAVSSVLEHLASDKSPEVLMALVANSVLPQVVLESLAFHKRSEVREAAATRLDTGLVMHRIVEDSATPELRDVGSGSRNRLSFVDDDPAELAATGTEDVPAPVNFHAAYAQRTAPVRGFKAK